MNYKRVYYTRRTQEGFWIYSIKMYENIALSAYCILTHIFRYWEKNMTLSNIDWGKCTLQITPSQTLTVMII